MLYIHCQRRDVTTFSPRYNFLNRDKSSMYFCFSRVPLVKKKRMFCASLSEIGIVDNNRQQHKLGPEKRGLFPGINLHIVTCN